MAIPLMGYENAAYINTNIVLGDYDFSTPTWTEMDLMRDATENHSLNKVDVTSRRTARLGKIAYAYGLGEDSLQFDSLIPAAGSVNAAFTALVAAQQSRKLVDLLLVEGGEVTDAGPLPAFRMVAGVFGGNVSQPNADVSVKSFDLAFALNDDQDVPQIGTVALGDFTPAA